MQHFVLLLAAAAAVGAQAPTLNAAQAPTLNAAQNTEGAAPQTAVAPTDQPLAAFRTDLLDLAFRSATALPVKPHIKDRSRAQEEVVDSCLELDQPARALGYIGKIDNWRRGSAYADLAFHCAQHGQRELAQQYLDLARKVAEAHVDEGAQAWQRDRIRAKVAKTCLWLGLEEEAARFEQGLELSEKGEVASVRAMLLEADAVDGMLESVDAVVATGHFDRIKQSLEACAQVFHRFYADTDRRAAVEAKIKASWAKLPLSVRLDLLAELAGFALDRDDPAKALELVNESRQSMDGATWTPGHSIPRIADLAQLRFRAGDEARARSEADAALAAYYADRDKIVDIERARTLRPLAEAFHAMGNAAAAATVYRTAVEEGVTNPNSRPRAEDLAATCRSMALRGFEPDPVLAARLREIHEKLGTPW